MACSCSSLMLPKMEAKISANWYICSMRCSREPTGPLTVSAVALGNGGSLAPGTAFDLDLIDISSETDDNFRLTVFCWFGQLSIRQRFNRRFRLLFDRDDSPTILLRTAVA